MTHIMERVSSTPPGHRLDLVHRVGAATLGAGLIVFGALGVIHRVEFLAVHGQDVLGLSSNGLLSTISLIVGAVLIAAPCWTPISTSWRSGYRM
ncbi:MAG: hypothetical protein ACRDRO_18210 [Pseudonocardiaceae bacterium]